MEIIFSDPYYDSEDWEEGKYASELAEQLTEFDQNVTISGIDIGHGADCPGFLVEIFKSADWPSLVAAGATGLFLLGDQINKNLDAWIEIAKKFKRLTGKLSPTRIDQNGAVLIVLHELLGEGDSLSEMSIAVQIIVFTPVPWGKSRLGKHPDALYLVTVRTSEKLFVYGVKSSGRIEFRHEFVTDWLDF